MTPVPGKSYGRSNLPVPAQQRLTEKALQETVVEMCAAMNLYVYHTFDSRRSAKGFPDLVIVGNRVLFRELKDWQPTSKPTREQLSVLSRLMLAGQDAAVWRPEDLFSGAITEQLNFIRRPVTTTQGNGE